MKTAFAKPVYNRGNFPKQKIIYSLTMFIKYFNCTLKIILQYSDVFETII